MPTLLTQEYCTPGNLLYVLLTYWKASSFRVWWESASGIYCLGGRRHYRLQRPWYARGRCIGWLDIWRGQECKIVRSEGYELCGQGNGGACLDGITLGLQ